MSCPLAIESSIRLPIDELGFQRHLENKWIEKSGYDQEIPQPRTAEQPMAPWGGAAEH